jgi:hypothetical protein
MEISASSGKTNRECSFQNDFGADLDDATTKFGKDVIYSIWLSECVTRAQNQARSALDKPELSIEEAITRGTTWRPGVVRIRAARAKVVQEDPKEALARMLASGEMSMEDLVKELRTRTAAAKAAAKAAEAPAA